MAASESTKFQINYKLQDGTLINLYAADVRELETGLTDLSMVSALITSTADSFRGSTPAAAVHNPAPAVNRLDDRVNPPQPQVVEGQTPECKHGLMQFRSGNGAKGPWKGWMCPSPQGAPDKCRPIFVR